MLEVYCAVHVHKDSKVFCRWCISSNIFPCLLSEKTFPQVFTNKPLLVNSLLLVVHCLLLKVHRANHSSWLSTIPRTLVLTGHAVLLLRCLWPPRLMFLAYRPPLDGTICFYRNPFLRGKWTWKNV